MIFYPLIFFPILFSAALKAPSFTTNDLSSNDVLYRLSIVTDRKKGAFQNTTKPKRNRYLIGTGVGVSVGLGAVGLGVRYWRADKEQGSAVADDDDDDTANDDDDTTADDTTDDDDTANDATTDDDDTANDDDDDAITEDDDKFINDKEAKKQEKALEEAKAATRSTNLPIISHSIRKETRSTNRGGTFNTIFTTSSKAAPFDPLLSGKPSHVSTLPCVGSSTAVDADEVRFLRECFLQKQEMKQAAKWGKAGKD